MSSEIRIGKLYIVREDGLSRLCADITIGRHRTTLWFAVESSQEDCLCIGRSDPFVMALLPAAMRGRHKIVCEDPMSERLHYQLCCHVIPALAFAGELYHVIPITAPLTAVPYPNKGAVGTGFSGGVDSMYTVMCHGPDSDYPMTHLALFDIGGLNPRRGPEKHAIFYSQAKRFAEEQGLKTISVRTNLGKSLSKAEAGTEIVSFRNLACALSVQGLFSAYLISTAWGISYFSFNLHDSEDYDPFLVPHASTESLTFYPSGVALQRYDKLKSLFDWEPSRRWLHSCYEGAPGEVNCGRCKKCIRDMTALYALDKLELYEAVYDIKAFKRNLAARLGSALAKSDKYYYDDPAEMLKESGKPIPPAAWVYAKQFERAMENLREFDENRGRVYNEQ